jgi:hypothetical protein
MAWSLSTRSGSDSDPAPTASCCCSTRSPYEDYKSPRQDSPHRRSHPGGSGEQSNSATRHGYHTTSTLSWAIAFHRTVGKLATDNWRTPRYVAGRYPVPQVGSGQRRHPITIKEIPLPDGQAINDLELTTLGEVKPDISLEVRIDSIKLTFGQLVELELTERPSYKREKLLVYDAYLCGWCLEHPRYKTLGTRPVALFACRDERSLVGCAKAADEALTGRIGVMGCPGLTSGTTPDESTCFSPGRSTFMVRD